MSDALGEDEWLTVAARDGRGLRGSPAGRRTLMLRLRGRDLIAHRHGRISADELRTRIDVR